MRKTGEGMEFDNLKRCVEKTIGHIYTRETYLITHGLSEWTLSAQFHYYMRKECQEALQDFNFDSEYNLMSTIENIGVAEKIIFANGQSRQVRPDFIIHKRGNPTGNFLWVEMKRRSGDGWKADLERTRVVTQEHINVYGFDYVSGYDYGLGVLFRKRNVICKWYANGNEIDGRIMAKDPFGAWKWSDVIVDVCGHLLSRRRI